MSTADEIKQHRTQHPEWTLQKIADSTGVSREYVRQVLSKASMPTRSSGPKHATPSGKTWKNRFGGSSRLSPHSAGMVAELVVAADLISRGYDVYQAIAADTACDLIVADGAKLSRIEVRSATPAWRYNWKSKNREEYDVLAIVTPSGEIRYSPGLPQEAQCR